MISVTIVPAKNDDGTPDQKCRGTQVLLLNGEPIPGVRKVVLTGEAGGRWVAQIECVARLNDVTCLASAEREFIRPTWREIAKAIFLKVSR